MITKGRITMADVDAEIGKVKGDLNRALSRAGLALLRLRQAANELERRSDGMGRASSPRPFDSNARFRPSNF
jgi:hypothetical protein